MRPHEIDYSDTRKPYFDLENGEVLIGREDRQRYVREAGAGAVRVVELGPLLRDPTPYLNLSLVSYEEVDSAGWPRDRLKEFGAWLTRTVAPPRTTRERHLNTSVLSNACFLGLGPEAMSYRREFGGYGNFYAEIKAKKTLQRGAFDEWSIEDFVNYIKKSGKDRRPTRAELEARSDRDSAKPRPSLMHNRFLEQGGFNKLLELAGYPVIESWTERDFIDWGIKFMEANDGQVPGTDEFSYLSQKKQGPSARVIYTRFVKMTDYQAELIAAYGEVLREARALEQMKLACIVEDIQAGRIEPEVFDGPADSIEALVERLSSREAIARYARYRVLRAVKPDMLPDAKIRISVNEDGQNITSAINSRYDVLPGEIESAALCEGVFDDLWPMDDHLVTLRLAGDEGYAEYKRQKSQANIAYKRQRESEPALSS